MSDEHKEKSEEIRYIWFGGATLTALRDRLNTVLDNPDARLVVTAPFNEHATIEVVDPSQDAAARLKPLNEAHPCPPQC